MNHDISQIATTLAARYSKHPKRTGNGFDTNCPCHEDDKGSLSVGEKDGKLVVCCQAGCDQNALFKKVIELSGTAHQSTNEKTERQIHSIYRYKDANENIIFEKVRYIPKNFLTRRPDGNGDYIWNTKGIDTTMPYRLPEIRQAIQAGEHIYIPEGEKDCDNLLAIGLVATCNLQGASTDDKAPKWTDKHTAWLTGIKGAVILPHNDNAGKAHASAIAKSLTRSGIKCKILELPNLPDKGDVSDWLVAGGTKEQLEDLAANAEVWKETLNGTSEAQASASQENNKPDYTLDEVKAALNAINKPNTFEWLNVGHALKGAGLDLELWESWTKEHDPHYSPGECATRWTMREFKHTTFNIRDLWSIAAGFGFEKAGYTPNADHWLDPEPITDELLPVLPLLPEMLPEPYRAYIIDVSERMSCPPEFVTAALLTITGSIIGTAYGIKPKRFDDWLEVPNIWGAIVATPGQLKSPAIEAPGKFLSEIEKSANESNELVMQQHIAEYKAYEALESTLTTEMKAIAKNTFC